MTFQIRWSKVINGKQSAQVTHQKGLRNEDYYEAKWPPCYHRNDVTLFFIIRKNFIRKEPQNPKISRLKYLNCNLLFF